MPKVPPSWDTAFDGSRIAELLQKVAEPTALGRYLHWDQLIRRTPPEGLNHEEWWKGLKIRRLSALRRIPLRAKKGLSFSYLVVDPLPKVLHEIDLMAGGVIQMPQQVTSKEMRSRYVVRSLIEEAVTSSMLEGAATTREIAKEMLQQGRVPRDRSEQMVLNNYRTMQRIAELQDETMSKSLVFDIHRMVTDRTLDDQSAAGRLRRHDEHRVVGDDYGEVFHDPPASGELDERLAAMCEFANDDSEKKFIHPVIRSIILHFWLAYDHPFVDGNGRTARALFYWSMLRHKYWLFEYISISRIILKAPMKYYRAFLHTETDDNDLTYFLLYHVDIIRKAIAELHQYIENRSHQLKSMEDELRGMDSLNYRQRELIGHALRHPGTRYTIESHRNSHNVVHQTARTDLLELMQKGFLTGRKIKRNWHFNAVPDLEQRLRRNR